MKNAIMMIFVLLTLVSCGKYAKEADLNNLSDRVGNIEQRLAEMEQKINASITVINELYQAEVESVAEQNTIKAMIDSLQEQTNALMAKQSELELEDRVVGIYDPCPSVKSNSFTEVIFEMKSGKFVAYFEDGGKRFLTVLKPGTLYRTTDSRACTFTL